MQNTPAAKKRMENRTLALYPAMVSPMEDNMHSNGISRSEYIRSVCIKWLPILQKRFGIEPKSEEQQEETPKIDFKIITVNLPEKINSELVDSEQYGFTSASEFVRAMLLLELLTQQSTPIVQMPIVKVEFQGLDEKITIGEKAYKLIKKGAD